MPVQNLNQTYPNIDFTQYSLSKIDTDNVFEDYKNFVNFYLHKDEAYGSFY